MRMRTMATQRIAFMVVPVTVAPFLLCFPTPTVQQPLRRAVPAVPGCVLARTR